MQKQDIEDTCIFNSKTNEIYVQRTLDNGWSVVEEAEIDEEIYDDYVICSKIVHK